ncbi:MAG: IS481 family transposase [Actinomycetota bacterium]
MDLARYLVDAVVLEGRSYREVAAAHGVSKSWVAKLVGRYRCGGYQAIVLRSRRPRTSPTRTPAELEDQIIRLRKLLSDDGFDAGPQTIHHHLSLTNTAVPSVATIWRILRRRGFITPQPQKRPRSSWIRFEASLPNECWQSDVTHWRLKDITQVEIVNFIDDYSRLIVASKVVRITTAPAVLRIFHEAAKAWGFPAAILTDNGCVYTAAHRGGRAALEQELVALGITFKHSRPYHPQTCGKVERFHQTLKTFLAKQPSANTIEMLQTQIDRFVAYYNTIRPHRARNRLTPQAAFDARDKARPAGPKIAVTRDTRVRRDIVDPGGKITLRHKSKLHHIGVSREHTGKRVIILVAGLDVRVLSVDGELIRALTLDPSKDYQPTGRKYSPKGRKLGPRKKKTSTMS